MTIGEPRRRVRESPTTRRNAPPARPVGPGRTPRPPPRRAPARTARPRRPAPAAGPARPATCAGTASGPACGSPDSSTRSPQKTTSGGRRRHQDREVVARCARGRHWRAGPAAAAQVERRLAGDRVLRAATRTSTASAASRRPSPCRTASPRSSSRPRAEQLVQADRAEHLGPGEGRGAQDMVEVRVGERDMRHRPPGRAPAPARAARRPPRSVEPVSTSSAVLAPTTSPDRRSPSRAAGDRPDPAARAVPTRALPKSTSIRATLAVRARPVPRRRSADRPLPGAYPRPYTGPGSAGTRDATECQATAPATDGRTGGVRDAERTQARGAARHRPGLCRHRGAGRLQGAHRAAQPRCLPGHRPQRHGGPGGRGLHRPAAHQRRAHPHRQGLPPLRRQARRRQAADRRRSGAPSRTSSTAPSTSTTSWAARCGCSRS